MQNKACEHQLLESPIIREINLDGQEYLDNFRIKIGVLRYAILMSDDGVSLPMDKLWGLNLVFSILQFPYYSFTYYQSGEFPWWYF